MFLLILVVLVALFVRYGLGPRTRGVLREAFRPAFLLGGIGFVAGFVGPMIFMPSANQGPLLGIFITGPGGFVLGLAYGVFRALFSAPAAPNS